MPRSTLFQLRNGIPYLLKREKLSSEDFTINNGERIAQMIIAKHERVEWVKTEELEQTKRGGGGFGHTGI